MLEEAARRPTDLLEESMTGLTDLDREAVISFKDGYAVARLPLSFTEQSMVEQVLVKLVGVKDYEGVAKNWFTLLVVRLCKFLKSRHDLGAIKEHYLYLKRVKDRSKLPHESELQLDLYNYLLSTFNSPLLEVPHIAAGRTDIYLPFESFRFVIEIKRSTAVKWSCFSARPHSRQAAAYSSADVRLGILATLDLSIREPGTPHVSECFGVIRRRLSRNDERTVVFMRVPGNRLSPSTLSE